MSIFYHESTRVFQIDTLRTSYQMQVSELGHLLHLYYGNKLINGDATHMVHMMDRGFSGNPSGAQGRGYSLDLLPQEYPTFGGGDYRESCLEVRNADGSSAVELTYRSYSILHEKYDLPGLPAVYDKKLGDTLAIQMEDRNTGLEVTLLYGIIEETDTITRAAVIKNAGEKPVVLEKALSCCLDFWESNLEVVSLYGRHCGERNVQRVPAVHGKHLVESTRGTSSHQYHPFLMVCPPTTVEDHGACWGVNLVYSGSFMAQTEVDQMDSLRLVMGINPKNFSWRLEPGESFATPEAVMIFSDHGIGRMSRCFHKLYRQHLCRGKWKDMRRPIVINNWEATYFSFDEEKLIKIAEEASKLGIEMLVMDDGWFGKRDSDNSGLGDWTVNEEKLRGGLAPLSKRIHELGMKMGIWFEPEMVSEDSALFRAHPDWALRIPGRDPVRSRNQLVLDMSRQEVVDYLFDAMSSILRSAPLEYVKWDMNRHLCDVWSAALPPERQGEVYHRYVLGVYQLAERLFQAFPDVLFEGCSGGGGRFDPGMLYYSPQIWCSDNTDAIERIKIQYGTSMCYPLSSMGAHVSVCPNHQTGRTVPIDTRAAVAMTGAFGYELDLCTLSQEDKDAIRKQIVEYKRYYSLLANGNQFRLTNPFQNNRLAAWEMLSDDRSEMLLTCVYLQAEGNPRERYLRLRGLHPDFYYQVTCLEQPEFSMVLAGSILMNVGLVLPMVYGDFVTRRFMLEKLPD